MAVTARGINARLEVALTMAASPKTITAFTKSTTPAAPNALVTSTAHALTAGTIAVLSVTDGMMEAHGQAIRVISPTTDAFTAQGFDNSPYGAWVSGTLRAVATWGLLSEAIGWEEGGGDAKTLDDTRLIDVFDRNISVGNSAQTLAITMRGQNYSSDVARVIENAALNGAELVFRLTFNQANGPAVRYCNGVPSLTTFGIQQGALGSAGFSITPTGRTLSGSLT
jgi:hypothetical protein